MIRDLDLFLRAERNSLGINEVSRRSVPSSFQFDILFRGNPEFFQTVCFQVWMEIFSLNEKVYQCREFSLWFHNERASRSCRLSRTLNSWSKKSMYSRRGSNIWTLSLSLFLQNIRVEIYIQVNLCICNARGCVVLCISSRGYTSWISNSLPPHVAPRRLRYIPFSFS